MQTTQKKIKNLARQRGSATFEYAIVSTFAVVISVATLTFIGKMFKGRVQKLAERVGADSSDLNVDVGIQ